MDVFADAEHYSGDAFELFGRDHLMILTVVVLFQVLLLNRYRDADEETRRNVRWALVAALWAQEVSYHAWRLTKGTWSVKEMLPGHLCSVAVWLGGLTLLTRNDRLYQHIYYIATAGALGALSTPDVGRFGFPHYRFFQFFASHGLILAVPLWMTFVEGRRPAPGSWGRALAGTLGHAAAAWVVNRKVGSNYMFVSRKPSTTSSLDALPEWPAYLPLLFGAVAGFYGLLYAPWALKDAAARRERRP